MQEAIAPSARSEAPARSSAAGWERTPYGRSLWQQFVEVWRRRRLLGFLIYYGIAQSHGKTLLGLGWLIIRPAIMVIGAILVVGHILGVTTSPVPLLLFMVASFAPWLLFQRGMAIGTKSLSKFKNLLNNFYFPRVMVQIAAIGPSFIQFLVVATAALLVIAYYALTGGYVIPFGWHTLWVPVGIAMMVVLVWALSFFTAPLNELAADTSLTLRYVLTLIMIASPVFYPIQQLSENVRGYMWYNPISSILEVYRWGLFHQDEPAWGHVWLTFVGIFIIFAAGWWFYCRFEQRALGEL